MAEVNVTVIGYAGNEPQLMKSKSGLAWTSFNVGATKSARDGETGQWVDGPTLWFKVKAWGPKAENVVDSIHKGTPVVVSGRLSIEPYSVTTKGEGETTIIEHRSGLTVENAVIAVDTSRGVARYTRVERDQPIPADAPRWVTHGGGVPLPGVELPGGGEYGDGEDLAQAGMPDEVELAQPDGWDDGASIAELERELAAA